MAQDQFQVNIDSLAPVPAGGDATYKVRIDNAGNFTTGATTVTFDIPVDTDYEGVLGLDNCDPLSGEGPLSVICDVPAIGVDGAVEATVFLRHFTEGTVTFAAEMTEMADETRFERTTTVQKGADLGLTLSALPETVQAGDIAQFFATVTNHGPYPSGAATLDVTIPDGMSPDFELPAACSVTGLLISCVVPPLGVDETFEFEFSSQVTTADESDITMDARLISENPRDPNAANDGMTAHLAVLPGTDLSLGKARSPLGLLLVGQEVEFTLTPRVAGQDPKTAQITDDVPVNYTITEVLAEAGWTCAVNGQVVTCDYDSGEAGADYHTPIVIKADVAAAGEGIVNTAEIESEDENAGADGNNRGADIPANIVPPTLDLRARKAGPFEGLVVVGEEYDFRLWAVNDGNLPFDRELTYTDHIPVGLTVTAISAPLGWTCPTVPANGFLGAQDISCTTDKYTSDPLRPGERADTITITAKVTQADIDPNGLTVSYLDYEEDDATPGNNVTNSGGLTSVEPGNAADVGVIKSISPTASPVVAGDAITFRIEVVNSGPATAEDVRLEDRLEPIVNPIGHALSYPTVDPAFDANGMVCSFGASGAYYYRDLSCTIASLPICTPGDDCPFVDVTVHAGGVGSQSNTAVAYSFKTPDRDTSNNESMVPYEVDPRTDVTITKTSASINAGAAVGQPITYVIAASVLDNGLSPADGVIVRDTLPKDVRFISATPSHGGCSVVPSVNAIIDDTNRLIQCEVGQIGVNSQRTVEVVVVPTMALLPIAPDTVSEIVNSATVTTTTPEVDEDNNDASVSIPINPPSLDLIVSKEEYLVPDQSMTTPDPVLINEQVGYRIIVTNVGPSDATDVVLTDILPKTGFVAPSLPDEPDGWTCDFEGVNPAEPGGDLVCKAAYFPAGETAVFEFTMKADERGLHTNRVEASSEETRRGYDSNPGNNEDAESTRVRVRSDLQITKTPEKDEVDLREEFYWDLTVVGLTDTFPGLDVAEAVTLHDTFPQGMIISRAPEILHPQTGRTCNAPLGTSALSCDLGDVVPGETVTVRVWVRIVEPHAPGTRIVNTARVNTQSFDLYPGNNEDEGEVATVRASTIEGTIWRDFNADDVRDAVHDTGLAGITVTLTGTAEHDPAYTANATTTTAADGTYIFNDLPPGTYQVAYTFPGGGRYEPGSALPGDGAPSAPNDYTLSGIVVAGSQTSSNHDFTLIPQAQLSVTKTAADPVFHSDGSYSIAYTVVVTNGSEEPLENVSVIDDLVGAGGNFGSYTSASEPGRSEYTVTVTEGRSDFTGQGVQSGLWTDGALDVAGTASLEYTLRVNPEVPRVQPLAHTNVANATGDGEWSGQTPATNDDLADSDSVVVTPDFDPEITITKTASLAGSTPPAVGNVVTYTFRIENTGKTPLIDVSLTDDLSGLQGLSTTLIDELAPGEHEERTATYVLTQDDLDNGSVANTASTSGQWGEDSSGGKLTVTDSDTATVLALANPMLKIEKTILSTTVDPLVPTRPTDTITYQFVVTNTGNTNLRNVVVKDPLLGADVTVGNLPVTDRERTVTATYTVTQADIDAGEVDNTAHATGLSGPNDTSVNSDTSSAKQRLYQQPGLVLVKVVDSIPDEPRAGDSVRWTVTATNTGNVTLHDVSVSDPFLDAVVTPPADTTVAPGASINFTVTAPLTQDHINAGEVINQATAAFKTPDDKTGTPVDSSNDPSTPDTPEDTVTPLNQSPKIGLVKRMTGLPTIIQAGAELPYSFTITNLGNLPLSALKLEDGLKDFVLDDASIELLRTVTLHPLDADEAPTASPNEIVVQGVYTLTQSDIEAGKVVNTAEATGTPTHGPDDPVSAESTVETSLARAPQISLVKTVSATSFGPALPMVGDTITYAFSIENTGNVILDDIEITEQLIGARITNPTGWTGPLAPGSTNTDAFIATYTLTQNDIDAGELENTATVFGTGIGPDGDLTTVTHDSTVTQPLSTQAAITIVKAYEADLSTPPMPGDEITYTFLVTNTGNVTLSDVEVDDPLTDLNMPVTTIPLLLPGADNAVELTATYLVKQSDIQRGEVVNQASVSGDHGSGSTSGTVDADSNEIRVPLSQVPSIAIIKEESSALNDPTQVGEEIEYTFIVRNTGNLELTGVVIDDRLIVPTPASFAIGALSPGDEVTVGPVIYAIVQDDIDAGEVINQATATGTYDDGSGPEPTSDLSGPTFEDDEPVVVEVFQPRPSLAIEKTATFMGGSFYALVGDPIDFEFTIENTGNVDITGVSPRELDFTFNGQPAENTLSAFDPLSADLKRGETVTFTARYLLTQGDLNAGANVTDGVSNTAEAVGTFDGAEVTSPDDTAILTLLPQPPSDVSITKTTTRPNIRRGETVPFTIRVENHSLADAGLVTITDRIPAGFVYVEDSAQVDGAAFTPSIAGRDVTFADLRLVPKGVIEIDLVLRALPATPPGRYTNIAFGIDALGTPLEDEGRATVEILAEAVFDCSDIIGTVFDDLNGNGYQDEGEPGIPGVRLSTATGTLVTTDAFGRYSIPCAALPAANVGSNFVLKIDARTLPAGFALTTDNPAMVRLTPGKMVEINFGVSLGREIRITIGDAAFVGGGTEPTVDMLAGISQLTGLLAEDRSRLVVVLEATREGPADARAEKIIALIRQSWRDFGAPYALDIETTVIER